MCERWEANSRLGSFNPVLVSRFNSLFGESTEGANG